MQATLGETRPLFWLVKTCQGKACRGAKNPLFESINLHGKIGNENMGSVNSLLTPDFWVAIDDNEDLIIDRSA